MNERKTLDNEIRPCIIGDADENERYTMVDGNEKQFAIKCHWPDGHKAYMALAYSKVDDAKAKVERLWSSFDWSLVEIMEVTSGGDASNCVFSRERKAA